MQAAKNDEPTHALVNLLTGEEEGHYRRPPSMGAASVSVRTTRFQFAKGGRWVNVGKAIWDQVWDEDSGYTNNEKLLLGYFLGQTKPGVGAIRLSKQEWAAKAKMRPTTVGTCLNRMAKGRLLMPEETHGRLVFYRVNHWILFDGSSELQNQLIKNEPYPIVPFRD